MCTCTVCVCVCVHGVCVCVCARCVCVCVCVQVINNPNNIIVYNIKWKYSGLFSLKIVISFGLCHSQGNCLFRSVFNKPHCIIFIRKTKIFTWVFLGYFLYKLKELFLLSWWICNLKNKLTKCHEWLCKSENSQCFTVIKYVQSNNFNISSWFDWSHLNCVST